MIMPFIRLVTIYVLVIVAVTAFFKRDQLMQFTSASFGWPAAQGAVPNAAPEAGDSNNTAQASEGATPVAEPEVTPTPPNDAAKTAQLPVIQMPVADPENPEDPAESTPTSATQTPTAVAGGDVPQTAPAAANTATRLKAARQAYWQGDLAGSEALYAALAKAAPDNPDVIGEFGNILFAQRRYGAAADAYLTTGRLLVASGRAQQVKPIIAVLQNIAPQKAATLRALADN